MDRSLISLRSALFGFVILGAAAFSAVAMLAVQERIRSFQETALERAVTVRAQGVALDLARTLEQDWAAFQAATTLADFSDLAEIGLAADLLVGERERKSWAGFAGLDGRVAAASGDMLIGADISERSWFQRGLEGPFAGDARNALLLNRLLGGTDEEPIRFLDLSTPVRNASGEAVGVFALHLNFDWTSAFLAETARVLEIDLFLVSHDGTVIFSSDGSSPDRLDLPSMRAAQAGAQVSGREMWPDGREYLTSVVPGIEYGDLPSFGWRLVARILPAAIGDTGHALTEWVLLLLASGFVVLVGMTFVFERLFLKPIRRLASDATRLADEADIPPLETRSTREAAAISSALVRLQGQGGLGSGRE